MRCPKCLYISFDSTDRCRNCGYEFSLSVDAAALDLPIQTGEEAIGPLSDFALGELDQPAPEPLLPITFDLPMVTPDAAAPPPHARERRPIGSAADLPLFKDRAFDDDTPLVTPPAVPRAPLSVRRSTPVMARAQTAAPEPRLDLEMPDARLPSGAPEPAPRAATAGEPDNLRLVPAGIGPRVVAALVDVVILAAIDAAVLYFTLKISGFTVAELPLLPLVPLVAFLLMLAGGYFVAFVAAGGQTIGKMAAGIKVVPDGDSGWTDRVPLGTAFVRAAAYLVSLGPAGAGLLPALLADDRRAVHDRLARTRVVKA
jgi:uncharacterized RDD family membrane protein YckC